MTPVHAEPLPKDMIGNWSLPDCRFFEHNVIHRKNFALHITEKKIWLEQVSIVGKGEDYIILETGEKQYPVRTYNDGVMEFGLREESTVPQNQSWDQLNIQERREYMRCFEMKLPRHELGLMAMDQMDGLKKSCTGDNAKRCDKALFKLSDKNKNKKLSPEEMVNTGMLLVYMSGLADGEPVKVKYVYDNIDKGYRTVPVAVNALLSKYDMDKSGDLSQDEFTSFNLDIRDEPSITKLQNAIKSMGQIFPSLLRFGSAD